VSERLAVGEPAPPFTLSDDTGKRVSLSDYAGRKVIVYFYPAAMTPGCTTQACDFSDSLDSLAESLTITLLSDPDKQVLRAYGAFGPKTTYGKTVEGVLRSTFVIDEAGRVADARYNVRAAGHVAKLRSDLGL
jgi:peroxiredoxin Q/BCP